MDRRAFLKGARRKNNFFSDRGLASGLNPYAGNWTLNEVTHLLKRTMFGAHKADIDHFLTLSPSQAVDELLNTLTTVNPPLRDYGLVEDDDAVLHDDLGVVQGQTWVNDLNTLSDPKVLGSINGLRVSSLHKWWVGLILKQDRSITEKMVLFWHHHFSVQQEEVNNATMLWRHHHLLRTNALGNVRQLTKDVTIDPAMLVHLNGYLNSKLAPDENYARELQELMTVGKGPDSLYTEQDVQAAARVLTGWRIDGNTYTAYLDNSSHDTGSKIFSAFYNNTTIGNNGTQEVNDLVDMIFNTTECARFICRKLYKWFVYYTIDDATETNVITPLAELMRSNNFDIKPVLSALLKSEHFFDPLNQACYIKSPYDIIAGTLREFNVSIPPYTYYQEPMNYELWVNSNSLPKRADFTDGLVQDRMLDLRGFAGLSSNPSDPDQLVADVTGLLLRYPLSAASRNWVKDKFLLNNSNDNAVWTNAWNTNNNAVIDPALSELFKFIMNLPEYHLC